MNETLQSSPVTTIISTRLLKEILSNAIVYADYVAGNMNSKEVKDGAKQFSAECEKQLARL